MKFRNISARHRNKVFKCLFKAKKSFKNIVCIDEKFYKSCNLNIETVEMCLNYFSAKGYIDLLPPDKEKKIPPQAELKAEAYTYFPDLKERKFKFWTPIILSIALSVASLTVSIVSIALQV